MDGRTANLYTKLYCQKGVLFRHKYLDLQSLSSATCFQNIVETIEAKNLIGLFAMETPFNSELIKQFYATLYVSGNPDDTKTWILEWMIQGQVFRMHSQEFMEIVNIPRHTGDVAKVHLLPDPTNAEFASLLDPEVTGDHMPENIRPKHLVFISKAWFYILSQYLMPLSTTSDEYNIHYHVRHALLKLSHGHVFDFQDCFFVTWHKLRNWSINL